MVRIFSKTPTLLSSRRTSTLNLKAGGLEKQYGECGYKQSSAYLGTPACNCKTDGHSLFERARIVLDQEGPGKV